MTSAKIPPQNLDAEKSLLGSIMLDKDAIVKIADIVRASDFYHGVHEKIFECMIELYDNKEPIDILSLSNKLRNKKILEEVGGSTFLTSLVNMVPTASNIEHYAKIVKNKSTLRNLIRAANEIEKIGYDEGADTVKLLDHAEQQIFSVSQQFMKQKFVPVKEVLVDTFDRIDELHKSGGRLRGVPTGFTELDNLLAGLQKSDLVILAARPSIGKTSLALDMARNAAVKAKVPVGVFSVEMSKEQLVDRLLCAEAGVDLWKMRTGKLGNKEEDDDFPKIGRAMGILSEAPIWIDDSGSSNAMEIRTKARRLASEHGLGLIVIDYLQLLEGRSKENRVQEISEITRELKGIARELNVPVLALSQLSRAVEARPDQRPKLSDLRESGTIEQDADIVLFIYREDKVRSDTDRKNIADIIIAKHRNGPTGEVEVYFQEKQASFKNLDTDHN